MADRRPHYPPAQPPTPDSPLGRALRDGHPVVPSLFDHLAPAPDPGEDAYALRMHLASRHASPMTDQATLADLIDAHEHEHDGPCTIRNHQRGDRTYDVAAADACITEAERELGGVRSLAGPGLTGRRHPDTSRDAAASDKGSERRRVLAYLEGAGPRGATAREMVADGIVVSTNQAGSRLYELRGDAEGFDPLVCRVWDNVDRTGKHRPVVRDGAAVHVALALLPDAGYWTHHDDSDGRVHHWHPLPARERPAHRAILIPQAEVTRRAERVRDNANASMDPFTTQDVLGWLGYLLGETDRVPW